MRVSTGMVLLSLWLCLAAGMVVADEQQIPPGRGLQSSVVVNTGANGLCETAAAAGDIQAATLGQGTPNRNEVRCGVDKVVQTAAVNDDVQLVAVGATCNGANTVIIDTGANGIAETPLAGDDTYASGITLGLPPSNTPCVIAGADGVAQTASVTGDDTQVLAAGTAAANTGVVLCGPNGVADTTANNVGPGDDVQVIAVGGACTTNQVVVDSGADGIAATHAEGPELLINAVRRQIMRIPKGKSSASRTVKVKVSNLEFGASAPATRSYKLTTTGSSCPGGTVTQLDADAATPGLQATANVPLGGSIKGSFVIKVKVEDVTSVASRVPFRCSFDVNAVAIDTAPSFDDADNPENNTATIVLEVKDGNDL
jgi:hypothetical protein